MKKLIRRIMILVSLVLFLFAGRLYQLGYSRYRSAVEATPLDIAIAEATKDKHLIPFEDMDSDFVNAVVSVEDKRFFNREGFDWIALARAVINNLQAGKLVEGGSTIPQQLAKNLYFTTGGRGLDEKIAEVFIMYDLEKTYKKDELFALYANINYYGDGYWGLNDAARGYFGASASNLSVGEAALLAGIPNAPGAYQLSTGYELAMQRQKKVLKTMLANGYLTKGEYEQALQEPIRLAIK